MLRKKLVMMLVLFAALVLSACGASDADMTPTVSVELVRTQAVMTFQAQLTQTAIANPTATPTITQTPTTAATFSAPTLGSPVAIGTGTTPVVAGGGQSSSCYSMAYVRDVTIPDGTQMSPGESFTKTWLVSNTGTCAWESGFTFNVVGGDAMGGSAVTLNQRVEPGSQYEFSVPMKAPTNQSGAVRGTWRLADAAGSFFGDGVYVEISVSGSAPTNTQAAPAASPTATTGAVPTAE